MQRESVSGSLCCREAHDGMAAPAPRSVRCRARTGYSHQSPTRLLGVLAACPAAQAREQPRAPTAAHHTHACGGGRGMRAPPCLAQQQRPRHTPWHPRAPCAPGDALRGEVRVRGRWAGQQAAAPATEWARQPSTQRTGSQLLLEVRRAAALAVEVDAVGHKEPDTSRHRHLRKAHAHGDSRQAGRRTRK